MIQTHALKYMNRFSALTLTTLAGILGISAFAESASAAGNFTNPACTGVGTVVFDGILREYTTVPGGSFVPGTAGGFPGGDPTSVPNFAGNCGAIIQLGIVQGRAGTSGPRLNGDYEIALSTIGANRTTSGEFPKTLQIDWESGQTYFWTLDWVPASNEATFTITSPLSSVGADKSVTLELPVQTGDGPFNAFLIESRADSVLNPGSTFNLTVTNITLSTGIPYTGTLSSTSIASIAGTTRFDPKWFILNGSILAAGTEITQMKGNFTFTGTPNPQDTSQRNAIGFKIQLLDPDDLTPSNEETIPEASPLVGLLGIGFLGLARLYQGKKAK